jgi:hypothetical protein
MKDEDLRNSIAQHRTTEEVVTVICGGENASLPVMKEFLQKLGRQIDLTYEDCASIADVSKLLVSGNPSIVVAAIQTREDLAQMVSFLSAQKARFSEGTLKVMIIDCITDEFTSIFLRMRGNVELLPASVSIKELNFKVLSIHSILQLKANRPNSTTFETIGAEVPIVTNDKKVQFEIDQVKSLFTNLELKIVYKDFHTGEPDPTMSIQLIEIFDQYCIFEIPEPLSRKGELALEVGLSDALAPAQNFKFKIVEVLGSLSGRSAVQVRLENTHAQSIRHIVKHFEILKNDRMNFYREARGAEE